MQDSSSGLIGKGQENNCFIREYAHSGTAVFRLFPETQNIPEIYMVVISQGSPLPVLVFCILHSSMPADIFGIFQRFSCEKMKECVPGGIKLISLGY
jgi:hypothetical protein